MDIKGTPEDELQRMKDDQFRRTHPTFPEAYRPKPKKVKDYGATQLQNDIEKFCKLNKEFAEQIATKGTYVAKIDSYVAGNYTKGSADVHIKMWSRSGELIVWHCEVKWGKDTMKPDQEKYRDSTIAFGNRGNGKGKGHIVYSIVKNFDQFVAQYNKLMENL